MVFLMDDIRRFVPSKECVDELLHDLLKIYFSPNDWVYVEDTLDDIAVILLQPGSISEDNAVLFNYILSDYKHDPSRISIDMTALEAFREIFLIMGEDPNEWFMQTLFPMVTEKLLIARNQMPSNERSRYVSKYK